MVTAQSSHAHLPPVVEHELKQQLIEDSLHVWCGSLGDDGVDLLHGEGDDAGQESSVPATAVLDQELEDLQEPGEEAGQAGREGGRDRGRRRERRTEEEGRGRQRERREGENRQRRWRTEGRVNMRERGTNRVASLPPALTSPPPWWPHCPPLPVPPPGAPWSGGP